MPIAFKSEILFIFQQSFYGRERKFYLPILRSNIVIRSTSRTMIADPLMSYTPSHNQDRENDLINIIRSIKRT